MHERQVILSQEDSLSKIAGLISPGSRVLEMGVAAGFFSAFLVNSLNCIVDALEFDQAAAKEVARWSRTLVVTDLSRLELAQLLGDNRYDYIIATEVVVQVGDPIRLVTEIRGLLAKNGSIILAVPNVTHFPVVAALLTEGFPYEHKGPVDNTYLRFFTRNSLCGSSLNAASGLIVTYPLGKRSARWTLWATARGAVRADVYKRQA